MFLQSGSFRKLKNIFSYVKYFFEVIWKKINQTLNGSMCGVGKQTSSGSEFGG